MTKHVRKSAAVLVCYAMALTTAGAQVEFGPVTGNAEDGKQLYYDYGCYGCHGFDGIGRKNLANDVSGIMFSEEVFLAYLRARSELNPLFPTQNMPNYPADSLPDDSAIDIYAFIRTFKDDPPEVEDIPALQAILDAAEQGQ
ncbi:MAG: c-type cytochrome [Woeseiaceae bacterium]